MPILRLRIVLAAVIAALFCLPAFATNVLLGRIESPRVVAVGDLHGDYEAFRAILADAGVIDRRGKWRGGETVLVQTGDVADRGPDTLKIIRHLMKLEKEAWRKGGEVIALIGNHEAMNMTGDLRYVTPEEFTAFRDRRSKSRRERYFDQHKDELRAHYGGALADAELRAKFETDVPIGYLEHRAAWSAEGEIGEWILEHDAVAQIDWTVFVHGGLSPAYASMPVDDINAAVTAALKGEGPTTILTDEGGPLWYRGNAVESDTGAAEIESVRTTLRVERLVVGHTPSLSGIKALYGGKVIVIDTGASAAFGGVRGWLEISRNGTITAHQVGTTPVMIWSPMAVAEPEEAE